MSASGRGFHITFENGWTVSVALGAGSYSDNRWSGNFSSPHNESRTAEIAAMKGDEWHHFAEDNVKGFCTPEQVLEFMNEISRKEA